MSPQAYESPPPKIPWAIQSISTIFRKIRKVMGLARYWCTGLGTHPVILKFNGTHIQLSARGGKFRGGKLRANLVDK
jgi:hypothetical protein